MLSPTHLLTPGEHFYCITSILQMAKLRLRQVRTRATIPKPLPFASQLYGDMCTTQKALIVVNSLCLPAKPVIKNNPHSAQCPLPSPALWAVQCTDGWGLPCGSRGTEPPQPAAVGPVHTFQALPCWVRGQPAILQKSGHPASARSTNWALP